MSPWARLRWPAIASVVIAVVLLLVAGGQVWFRSGPTSWTGAELSGGLVQAMAWLLAALVLLLLVVRVRGRHWVGAAMALVGLGSVMTGLLKTRPTTAQMVAAAATSGQPTGAAWVVVASGVLALLGGLLVALGASSWPVRQRATGTVSDHPIDLWKAQDRGLDPTSQDTAG